MNVAIAGGVGPCWLQSSASSAESPRTRVTRRVCPSKASTPTPTTDATRPSVRLATSMQMIIPALNEEAGCRTPLRTLRALRARRHEESAGPIDVIVVDNASTDGTAAVARPFDTPGDAGARRPLRAPGQRCRRPCRRRCHHGRASGSWTPTAPPTSTRWSTRLRAARRRRRPGDRVPVRPRVGHPRAAQPDPRARGARLPGLTRRRRPRHQRHPVRVQAHARRPRPRGVRADPRRRLLLRRRDAGPLPAARRPRRGVPRALDRRPGLDVRPVAPRVARFAELATIARRVRSRPAAAARCMRCCRPVPRRRSMRDRRAVIAH